MVGKLYVVATPIGNLSDITFRAVETLKSVDLILAEDSRQAIKLLKHYEINTHVESYHQHSDERKKAYILNELLLGKNVALVTDAGTPGISDPGNELVDFLVSKLSSSNFLEDSQSLVARNPAVDNFPGLEVVPIPGPSALTAALSISGLNVNKFIFLGFMPKKGRTKLFAWLKESQIPFVFYESPYRLQKTIKALAESFEYKGGVVVARELTKMYESIYRGDFKSILGQLETSDKRGEVVVIVDPS